MDAFRVSAHKGWRPSDHLLCKDIESNHKLDHAANGVNQFQNQSTVLEFESHLLDRLQVVPAWDPLRKRSVGTCYCCKELMLATRKRTL